MGESVDQQRVATVAQVIEERRSVRSFADEAPAREAVEQILAVGRRPGGHPGARRGRLGR